jgi:hypothetical protein
MYIEFNGIHFGHGPFLTSFDVSQKRIVSQLKFHCDIFKVFETVSIISGDPYMEFGVMLVDGSIYDQMRIDPTNPKIVLKDIS